MDTEGYAIKNAGAAGRMNEDLVREANATSDMFETNHFNSLEGTIARDENVQRAKVMQEMHDAIVQMEQTGTVVQPPKDDGVEKPNFNSAAVVQPGSAVEVEPVEKSNVVKKTEKIKAKPSIIELANNTDFSIATISKEANRLKERDEGEVFISLH